MEWVAALPQKKKGGGQLKARLAFSPTLSIIKREREKGISNPLHDGVGGKRTQDSKTHTHAHEISNVPFLFFTPASLTQFKGEENLV